MLDGPGFDFCQGQEIVSSPKHPDQLRGPPRLLFSEYRGSYQGKKWLVCDVNNSSPSCFKFKNERSYTSSHLVCLHGMDRDSLTVLFRT